MKTKILKWDVDIQKFLIVVNIIVFVAMISNGGLSNVWFFSMALSGFFQIIGNAIHILVGHKSIGYRNLRLWHFWCSLFYIYFFFAIFYAFAVVALRWVFVIIIPEAAFFAYFSLCYHELKYLQHREFHILR